MSEEVQLAAVEGSQGPTGKTREFQVTNGADGKTSYLHIKYSNDGGKTFTGNSGEDIGAYIGTCVDYAKDDPTSVGTYKWAKIKGEAGAKVIRVIRVRGLNRHLLHTRFQLPEQQFQLAQVWVCASASAGQYLWTRTIITLH